MITIATTEPVLVIVVVDGKTRYLNERIVRQSDETPEAFSKRVHDLTLELMTKPGKR